MNQAVLWLGVSFLQLISCDTWHKKQPEQQALSDAAAAPAAPSTPTRVFHSGRFPLTFTYPARFEAKITSPEGRNSCDSSIQIGYATFEYSQCDTCTSVDSLEVFVQAFKVYFTDLNFGEIADEEGFAKSELDYVDNPDSASWVILGRHGAEDEATSLHLPEWKGLKGSSVIGVFDEDGYAGLADFSAAFLTRSLNDTCSVVFSFYRGPNHQNYFTLENFLEVVASVQLKFVN